MKKKYKLKPVVKENFIFGLVLIVLITLFLSLMLLAAKRSEDIDSGKIILIKQEY